MVHGSKQSPICTGSLLVLRLLGSHGDVPLTPSSHLPRSRPGSYASGATVEANPVCRSVDYSSVVSAAHNRDVDVCHSAVVEVRAVSPVAAEEANASVAETVINSAIVADFRSPVASVPVIEAVFPFPIPRGPEQTDLRRLRPGARNPEVTTRAVSPIAGNPYVAGARADGLHIHRQSRRPNPNGNAHGNLRPGLIWDRQ